MIFFTHISDNIVFSRISSTLLIRIEEPVAEDSIELIPPFDIVKELEEAFDFEANIKLI